MRSFSSTIPFVFLTAISSVSATLNVHNWCTEPIYVWQSNNGDCDKGPNGLCYYEADAAPYVIPSGSIQQLDWINNNLGTAVKISKNSQVNDGILQFEYCMGDGNNFWDLSNLDGVAAAVVGTPFDSDNVRIVPIGTGTGTGNCNPIRCPAGQTCTDAYLQPEEVKTHYCPETVDTFWIDLCMPTEQFAKRATTFSA